MKGLSVKEICNAEKEGEGDEIQKEVDKAGEEQSKEWKEKDLEKDGDDHGHVEREMKVKMVERKMQRLQLQKKRTILKC